ncbi:MAG: hypothetical protein ACTSP6_02965 [Promethearchaeota archaeon]
MKPETLDFLIGILFSAIISYFLTFVMIWQLIIIPGIVAGIFNKKMKKGMYSGAIGISIIWTLYMIYAILTRNAYTNLDQFAGLIVGSLGFGWVLFLIILLFGALFGALGGAIGSGSTILIKIIIKNEPNEILESKKSNKRKES